MKDSIMYIKTGIVRARRVTQRTQHVTGAGNVLEGDPGDYLVEDVPPRKDGGQTVKWFVTGEVFDLTYREASVEECEHDRALKAEPDAGEEVPLTKKQLAAKKRADKKAEKEAAKLAAAQE